MVYMNIIQLQKTHVILTCGKKLLRTYFCVFISYQHLINITSKSIGHVKASNKYIVAKIETEIFIPDRTL